MPIEISCAGCNRRLRVPDKTAGKRIKCPQCSAILRVPAGEEVDSADAWYLKTEDGKDYGPISRSELDSWVAEGRVTAECQVLQQGALQWQWADDVYPQLTPKPSSTPNADLKVDAGTAGSEEPEFPSIDGPASSGGSGGFDFVATPAASSRTRASRGRGKKSGKSRQPLASGEMSARSKLVAALLAFFLGGLGIHRFYLGYTLFGVLQLVTAGGCGIWALVDFILILMGSLNDVDGRPLR